MRRYSPCGLRDQQFGCEHTGPLRHVTGFPSLGLLRVLRPIPPASAGNGPLLPTSRMLAGEGTGRMVPTFTSQPFDRVGAQLCPCNIATATPQAFTVASRSATSTDQRVTAHNNWCSGVRCCAAPIRQVRAAGYLEELSDAVPHVRLSVSLAGPGPSGGTGPSRRCQGCFPPLPPFRAWAALSFNVSAATDTRRCPFTTARLENASWRSRSANHSRSGRSASKLRSTRSAGLAASSSGMVVRRFSPLTTPFRPSRRMRWWRSIGRIVSYAATRAARPTASTPRRQLGKVRVLG